MQEVCQQFPNRQLFPIGCVQETCQRNSGYNLLKLRLLGNDYKWETIAYHCLFCLARIVPTSGKNLTTPPNAVLYNHSQLQLTPEIN